MRRLRALIQILSHPNSVAALGCYSVLALALTAFLGGQALLLGVLLLAIDVAANLGRLRRLMSDRRDGYPWRMVAPDPGTDRHRS